MTTHRTFNKILLLVILAAALALRLYPVCSGLPHTYWHDENNYIENALRFGTGNFSMITFSHGGLFQIVLFVEYAIYCAIGLLLGFIKSPMDFYVQYLRDPSMIFLIARVTSALFGAGIVAVSYLIAKKAYNARVAILASVFTAFSLIMVQMSSVALADMPAVFLWMAALYLLVRSIDRIGSRGNFYAACFLVGLATACKYYAAFGVATICAASFFKARQTQRLWPELFRLMIFGSLIVGAGFAIGVPAFLFNISGFFQDTFVRMGGEYITKNTNANPWLFYFTNHLRNGLGIPLEAALFIGLILAFVRRSKYDLLLLSFPVAYYLLIMHSTGYAYHLLPAMPPLLILGARAVDLICEKIYARSSAALCVIAGLLIVAPTCIDSIKYVVIAKSPDTRTQAKVWMEKNVPAGSTVLAEGYIFTAPVHAPPIEPDRATLERDLHHVTLRGGSGFCATARLKNFDALYGRSTTYDIRKVDRIDLRSIQAYLPQYIIISGTNDIGTGEELFNTYFGPDYRADRSRLRRAISDRYKLIQSFAPTSLFTPTFPHLMDEDYKIIRSMPLGVMLKGLTKGPTIEIFARKESASTIEEKK